jgi:hypothetical protein
MEVQDNLTPAIDPDSVLFKSTVKSQAELDADNVKKNDADAKEKAEALSKREGVKVMPILFYMNGNTSDPIVGFLKTPSRIAKVKIMDKSDQVGSYSAAAEALELCLLKGDSDMRLISEAPEYDDIYMGALIAAQGLINASINQIKKN